MAKITVTIASLALIIALGLSGCALKVEKGCCCKMSEQEKTALARQIVQEINQQ